MYKNRVKKWVGMIFLLAICVVINTNSDAYAASQCSSTDAKEHFGIDYKLDLNNDSSIKNVILTAEKGEFYIKIYNRSIAGGRKLEKIAEDNSIETINPNKPLKGGKSYTITADQFSKYISNDDKKEFLILLYKDQDKSASNPCDKLAYRVKIEISSQPENVETGSVPSIAKNTKVCNKARNLISKVSGIRGNEIINFIEQSMTPCFADKVPYNISFETLNNIYDKLEKFVDSYTAVQDKISIAQELPALSADWQLVENTNMNSEKKYKQYGSAKDEMLTCNTKNELTTKRFFHIKEEGHDAVILLNNNQKKIEACKTTCREQVEVTYGPPKAVIAGQCFTYEVEIKSKVVCNTSINFDDFPKYTDYAPCILKANCSDIVGYEEQAGPNEDFDKCVSTCDGGEYTQACINKCYNKVYNKKTTSTKKKVTNDNNENLKDVKIYAEDTLLLTSEKAKKSTVKKVADNNNEDAIGCPSIAHGSVSKEQINAVYEYVNSNITGNYAYAGETLNYSAKKSSCEWNNYGYAYFRDKQITARTVCNAKGLDWISGSDTCSTASHEWCLDNSSCYPGVRRSGATYFANSQGFKTSTVCKQECSWINTGLAGFEDGRACTYLDREQAEKDYVSSISNYIAAVTGCLNKSSSCVTDEEKAVYTMVANTDTESGKEKQLCDSSYGSQKNCLSWKEEIKKNTGLKRESIDNKTETDEVILKFNGGTCTNERNTEWIYHTIITFPGAWINNKNGEITYKNPNQPAYYKHYEGNYCTPLNAKNVNANWWLWYQYSKSNKTSKIFEEWATDKSLVYNIFSKIRKFGLFDWSMDVSCFYAINNQTPPPDTPPEDTPNEDPGDGEEIVTPTCKNGNCPPSGEIKDETTTDFDNYTSKSISTSTMFPSTKTSTKSTDKASVKKLSYTDKLANNQKMANSETRTEGFNWSVEATNLSIEGYPVTPSALVKKIESGKTYDESELDYYIVLTKDNIKKLKTQNDYTDFKGTYTTKTVSENYKKAYTNAGYSENSIPSYTYYKSDILRKSEYVTNNQVPKAGGLKCNNLKSSDSCDITLSGFTTQDEELQKWLSNVK